MVMGGKHGFGAKAAPVGGSTPKLPWQLTCPSYVEVPRPISSNMSRLDEVAFLSMSETSVISTMNVDIPADRSSEAPILVNTMSTMPTVADFAGTKEPICAMSTISAVCRYYLDYRRCWRPVMIRARKSSLSRCVSLGTKRASVCMSSTTGWRPSFIIILPDRSISGIQ